MPFKTAAKKIGPSHLKKQSSSSNLLNDSSYKKNGMYAARYPPRYPATFVFKNFHYYVYYINNSNVN